MKELITGCEAGSWACKSARVTYAPLYPITPSTRTMELLSEWKAKGELPDTDLHQLESEHSVMSAAIAASATGSRTYTATSSQGLMLMYEMLWVCSGLRLPVVLNNVSRGLSAPITLWSSHEDFLTCRDTGWLLFHAKSVQEVLDFTLMAFKIAEHHDVLLPVMVNMDGYELSYTEEIVDLPDQEMVDKFLGVYKSDHNISPTNKLCVGAPCMAEHYSHFRIQQYKAMENSRDVIRQVFEEWYKLTGRAYGVVDYLPAKNETDIVLVTQGSMSTTTRYVCRQYDNIGHLNLPIIRPLPDDKIAAALLGAKKVVVLDRNVMPGKGGIMVQEIKEVLYRYVHKPEVFSFIVGLGGVPQTEDKIISIINKVSNSILPSGIDFNDVV